MFLYKRFLQLSAPAIIRLFQRTHLEPLHCAKSNYAQLILIIWKNPHKL